MDKIPGGFCFVQFPLGLALNDDVSKSTLDIFRHICNSRQPLSGFSLGAKLKYTLGTN